MNMCVFFAYVFFFVRMYVYVYIHVFMHMCIHVWMHKETENSLIQLAPSLGMTWPDTFIYIHVCVYLCWYFCMFVFTFLGIFIYIRFYIFVYTCVFTYLRTFAYVLFWCVHDGLDTGWRRHIKCLKLQVIFCKRAINHRAVLRKMTCDDKASHGSSPPCTNIFIHVCAYLCSICVFDSSGSCYS